MPMRSLITIVMAAGVFSGVALGQEKTPGYPKAGLAAYDTRLETTLVGTVLTYTPSAQQTAHGAHLMLQTGAGVAVVHLGDARLLAANHFVIQSGDTLRIIGESVAYGDGSQFVARIVQKGAQALAVRTVRGIPLSYMAPRDGAQSKPQGSVL